MGIQSIGVGSGLDLNGLVSQLLEAESTPKYERLDKQEEELEAQISGVGTLMEKMDSFKDAIDELKNDYNLQSRSARASHPDVSEEDDGPFTAEAGNSALEGKYQISVEQLAEGSRIVSADADTATGFTSTSDTVASGDDTLTFTVGSDTFNIAVTSTTTLAELKTAINDATDNFGVTASIIDTGTSAGAKLVLNSDVTGEGNDLALTSTNGLMAWLADANSNTENQAASNAKAVIDGLAVESATNEFENVIEYVSFEVSKLSDVDYLDTGGNPVYKTSTLDVGPDKDALENKITDFVDNYNSLMDSITTLTKYGQSELEEDGALAGDFMVRGIQSGLASLVSGTVDNSSLGTLFQIGVSFDDDGKLQISDTDEYGFGSGQDKLDEALDDYFDEIATLFTDPDQGIASQMYDYVDQYTQYGGLLRARESAMKDQKELLFDQRLRVDQQISNYEQILRDKYISLDLTVSKLQRTGNALNASLGLLG
ncbi:flagellar hook protein [Saccharobesus litoralis]|uniref:Flagellar hook-associated protein 2 n=1 Tax=Saccharobesus litoralis TaxID=2172099 RepID=A0A2S0VUB2_9ALTE|nr:flagellar filament capping protein FliD [Saccharobesus litoralis]AWB67799.1 flagellar hook protein [Saccharobesus litoralis]